MRIAVMSDTRLPTAWDYPGHGLGKSMLLLAEGLAELGHEVGLFAGPGSKSPVLAKTSDHEEWLARSVFGWAPDVVLDGSHSHYYQREFPGYPVVNRSADREQRPGAWAVYPSRAHAQAMGEPHGTVIYSAVDERMFVPAALPARTYLLWLGPVDIGHKRVDRAIQTAQLAGMPLIIAGTGQIRHEGFIGPVDGAQKVRLIQDAAAVLVTGEIEAGPLTALEAAYCGTPVIGWRQGGTPEYVGDGDSGYLVETPGEAADVLTRFERPQADAVRGWALEHRGRRRMLAEYAEVLAKAAAGVRV